MEYTKTTRINDKEEEENPFVREIKNADYLNANEKRNLLFQINKRQESIDKTKKKEPKTRIGIKRKNFNVNNINKHPSSNQIKKMIRDKVKNIFMDSLGRIYGILEKDLLKQSHEQKENKKRFLDVSIEDYDNNNNKDIIIFVWLPRKTKEFNTNKKTRKDDILYGELLQFPETGETIELFDYYEVLAEEDILEEEEEERNEKKKYTILIKEQREKITAKTIVTTFYCSFF